MTDEQISMPVDAILPALRVSLAEKNRAILVAPPGSGKTSRVPLALATLTTLPGQAASSGQNGMPGTVLVLEPRRLAARSAARYMARQLGENVGDRVGFRVRLENKVSARTRVELITEGILTRRLLTDPELHGVSCVVFDEFHERSLQADLGLALCLEVQQALRPDLRLLVMSATLDVDPLRAFLDDCPVLRAEGKIWPVDIRYAPPATRAGNMPDPVRLAVNAVHRAVAEETGSILVFLPGAGEIRRAGTLLAETPLPAGVRICPLYGDLSAPDQDEAMAPCPRGQRKIVLATSLAETSLTIEGVRLVIDAGLSRTSRFDPATDMDCLVTERVTQANADQRAGRAGRTEPGVCYRLWPQGDALLPHSRPEIMEADLVPLLLETLAWGAKPEAISWLTPPPQAALSRARQTLTMLEAITLAQTGGRDTREHLTPHGLALSRLPLHPRLGHMVLQAGEFASLAACLAAIIMERDPLRAAQTGADIRLRLACLRDRSGLRQTAERIHALAVPTKPFHLPSSQEEENAGKLISLAWPERIAQRRARGSFRLASGRGASLPPEDTLADAPFLAVANLDGGGRTARSAGMPLSAGSGRIYLAAPLSREALEILHGHRIRHENCVLWDDREQAVLACSRTLLDVLILDERPLPLQAGVADAARQAVLAGIRSLGLGCLPWTDDLQQWRARVNLLRHLNTDDAWPDVSDSGLLDTLTDWLLPHLNGATRRSQFGTINLNTALRGLVPWPLDRALEQQAPTHMTVPSGSSVRIDYATEGGPVLAVKLQEMFGQTTTPTVAEGRVPLLVHLLSPAGRPLQVTRDLAGFWTTGYPAVRAEMRGRYPKHPWPEDPLKAVPTKKTKKKPWTL